MVVYLLSRTHCPQFSISQLWMELQGDLIKCLGTAKKTEVRLVTNSKC